MLTIREEYLRSLIVDDWFENHEILEYNLFKCKESGRTITSLVWGKPGTNFYRIQYLIKDNVLFVSGDVGHYTYQFSEPITLEYFLSKGTEADYYVSKCVSQYPDSLKEWDEQVAKEKLLVLDDIDEGIKKNAIEGNWITDEESWMEFVEDSINEKLMTGDPWDYADLGMTTNLRPIAHFIGLEMSAKYIQENESFFRKG